MNLSTRIVSVRTLADSPSAMSAPTISRGGGDENEETVIGTENADTINELHASDTTPLELEIFALGGNDTVTFTGSDVVEAEVDLGAGDDLFNVDGGMEVEVVTGDGIDTVNVANVGGELEIDFLGAGSDTVRIQAGAVITNDFEVDNFTAGEGGDVVDFTAFLQSETTWDGVVNPFEAGYLQLSQADDDEVMLQIDYDGGGDNWGFLLEINDAVATDFTAANFGGYAPVIGPPSFDGDDGDDIYSGRDGDDDLTGGDGDDTLGGSGGDDSVHGGGGGDDLDGGDGDDHVSGDDGDDHMDGDLGDDLVHGGSGDDTLSGGDGNDDLTGNSGGDDLDGSSGDDSVSGGGGLDDLDGGAGDDELSGGKGDDTMSGGGDDDTVMGGGGDDHLVGGGGGGSDDLDGGNGDDTVSGGGGGDDLDGGNGDDEVKGGGGDDTMSGGDDDSNDTLVGGGGGDDMDGGEGSDELNGGKGDDDISGGDGDDTVIGGGGDDTVSGGLGDDDFMFVRADGSTVSVSDFEVGNDVFDLSKIDADTAAEGNQAFVFVDTFTGAAGEATLSYDAVTGITTAVFQADADGLADLTLLIDGEVTADDGWVL